MSHQADPILETMRPDPMWDATAHAETVTALSGAGLHFHVWGADWCGDCRRQLPQLAAALAAAGVPAARLSIYPVTKQPDGSKVGPQVDAYGIELIPTVVIERDGVEVARVVEDAPRSLAAALADQL
ncbi:UNVERIFIED_CONTAM: thioredoxin [Euhalothece sp. KZN 001]|jgi:thiol-disulfide isomerase/thioredoxin